MDPSTSLRMTDGGSSRWSVVGARWAFESVGMVTASADGSFDFAQDDGWEWSVVSDRWSGRDGLSSQRACIPLSLMDPSTSLRMTGGSGR